MGFPHWHPLLLSTSLEIFNYFDVTFICISSVYFTLIRHGLENYISRIRWLFVIVEVKNYLEMPEETTPVSFATDDIVHIIGALVPHKYIFFKCH